MLSEIREQPAALERMLRDVLPSVSELKRHLNQRPPKLIVLAARGTSDNAAQFGRYLFEIYTGIPVSLAAPSVHTLYRARLKLEDALVIGVSQSGESTDVNVVLESAKQQGIPIVAVTNNESSAMAAMADHLVLVRSGKEESVAATKTYTGQLLAMYLIAHALGAPIEIDRLRTLPEQCSSALAVEDVVRHTAARYRFMEQCVVVGRGLNYANAFEMALKLMETCGVVAERFSSADFLHGPIAMVESSFPSFVFAPSGVTQNPLAEAVQKMEGLGAETFVISDLSGVKAARGIQLPFRIEELFTPIPYIVPAQLLAAYLATEKGLDPDRPKALTKVTRTL